MRACAMTCTRSAPSAPDGSLSIDSNTALSSWDLTKATLRNRLEESPAGYTLAGWSSPELTSASPTEGRSGGDEAH